MNVGKMRHRVTIKHFVNDRDPTTGEVTKQWTTFAVRWASIEPLRGREYWAAAQTQVEATHMIRMHYTPGITAAMRITYKGRVFEIEGPPRNLDEENRITELLAKEVMS